MVRAEPYNIPYITGPRVGPDVRCIVQDQGGGPDARCIVQDQGGG